MINLRSLILGGFAFALSNFSCSAGWFDLPKKGSMSCVGENACFNTPSSCDTQEAFDRCYSNCLQGESGESAREIAEKLFSCPHELITHSKFRSDIEKSTLYQELFMPTGEESIEMPQTGPMEERGTTEMPGMHRVPADMSDMPEMPESSPETSKNSPFLDQPIDDSMGMAHHQENRADPMFSHSTPEEYLPPMDLPSPQQQETFTGENPLESHPTTSWQQPTGTNVISDIPSEIADEDVPNIQGILQDTMVGELIHPSSF